MQPITALKSARPASLLLAAHDLEQSACLAADDDVGMVDEFYFDESTWDVPFLVVHMEGRERALISTIAIGDVNITEKKILVELTREQIRNGAGVDIQRQVWTRSEEGGRGDLLRSLDRGSLMLAGSVPARSRSGQTAQTGFFETHMRSSKGARGWEIGMHDGDLGSLEDFIVDIRYWAVRYLELEIEARDHRHTGHVLISPVWIRHMNWERRRLELDLTRGLVRDAPVYDPFTGISRDYEARLIDYFRNRAPRVRWD